VKTLVVPEGGELPPEEELEAARAAEAEEAEAATAEADEAASAEQVPDDAFDRAVDAAPESAETVPDVEQDGA
jgi:hypothetical protein